MRRCFTTEGGVRPDNSVDVERQRSPSVFDRQVIIEVFDLTVVLSGSLIPGPTPDWNDPRARFEMEFARDPSPID